MFVDIIIPAYNPGKYLVDAVRSCFAQEYKKYSVTVIDDYSDEDVKRLLWDFPSVKYIRNDKNLGPAASRNIGIKATGGTLVSFLDADDVMHPRKLKSSVKAFKRKADIGMICGNYRTLVNRVRLLKPFYKSEIKINHSALMRQNFVASGSVTVKRDVFDKVGYFNENYWIAEDYDMWLRISEHYPIEYIHEILYYYSVIPEGGSLTQREDIQERHIDNIEEIKKASMQRRSDV
jgi:GT2 family glycosyltransferase